MGIVEIYRHGFPHWITTVQASGSPWNMHTRQPFFLGNAPTLITYLRFIKVWEQNKNTNLKIGTYKCWTKIKRLEGKAKQK